MSPSCWFSLYRAIISPPFLARLQKWSGSYCRLKCFAHLCFGPFQAGHFPVAWPIKPIICHKLLLPPPSCSFKPCNTPGCVKKDFLAPCLSLASVSGHLPQAVNVEIVYQAHLSEPEFIRWRKVMLVTPPLIKAPVSCLSNTWCYIVCSQCAFK